MYGIEPNMRQYVTGEPLAKESFIITVQTIFRTSEWTFEVTTRDHIRELKCILRDLIHAQVDEMNLFPIVDDSPYPYPLANEMSLTRLQQEHRNLLILISDNLEKLAPRRLLITSDEPQKRPILDLTEATEEDMYYIDRWIVCPYHAQVRAVRIPWDSPQFVNMMRGIVNSFADADEIETRIGYPVHYYLVRTQPPTEEQAELITLYQRNILYRFCQELRKEPGFRQVRMYAEKGVLGNTSDEPMMLTKDNMCGVDLLLAEAIHDYQKGRLASP